ncbi:MAG TPA: glycosyltransferase family 4 protein [Holophaga sp.]|nr:glycosyltransferase family 4 protein [Holophaga sp.]
MDRPREVTPRIALVANTDWYLYNFRLDLARTLRDRHGVDVLCVSPDGPFRSRLQDQGFAWEAIRLSRQGMNPLADLGTVSDLTRIYRTFRPDLVHHFTIKPVLYGSMAAARAKVPRVVNALAGLGTVFSGTTLKGRLLRPLVQTVLRRVLERPGSLCILQNPDDAALIKRLMGEGTTPVHLIRGSGVDVHRFDPGASRQPVVLFVGRLLKDKGILHVCDAAERVWPQAPEVMFWIAGTPDPGNPASLTQDDVERLARIPNVRFLGHVESMADLYRQALTLVLPTQYGEGVPRSLVEGAACGLPLIATDHPGCREIVRPERNGFLIPAGDPEAIAQAVLSLVSRPDTVESMGRESRRIAVEEFSFEHVFNKTTEAYRELGLSLEERPS